MMGWLWKRLQPEPPPPLVVGANALFCVCDEEYCYCTEIVPVPRDAIAAASLGTLRFGNNPCRECRAGHHVWTPGEPRE